MLAGPLFISPFEVQTSSKGPRSSLHVKWQVSIPTEKPEKWNFLKFQSSRFMQVTLHTIIVGFVNKANLMHSFS
jgi:hypothetical protein